MPAEFLQQAVIPFLRWSHLIPNLAPRLPFIVPSNDSNTVFVVYSRKMANFSRQQPTTLRFLPKTGRECRLPMMPPSWHSSEPFYFREVSTSWPGVREENEVSRFTRYHRFPYVFIPKDVLVFSPNYGNRPATGSASSSPHSLPITLRTMDKRDELTVLCFVLRSGCFSLSFSMMSKSKNFSPLSNWHTIQPATLHTNSLPLKSC